MLSGKLINPNPHIAPTTNNSESPGKNGMTTKYDRPLLDAVAEAGGWRIAEVFTDPDALFWVVWMLPA